MADITANASLALVVDAIQITGGVDTYLDSHTAAAVDQLGRLLGNAQFPATMAGYRRLLAWLQTFGAVTAVGVEGTGSYGAGLARFLRSAQVRVVEVDRPNRRTRCRVGKSDPIDAEAAARAVLAGTATGVPKTRTGPVEAIRALRGSPPRRAEGSNRRHEHPAADPGHRTRAAARPVVRPDYRTTHRDRQPATGHRRSGRPGTGHQARAAPPRPAMPAPQRRDHRHRHPTMLANRTRKCVTKSETRQRSVKISLYADYPDFMDWLADRLVRRSAPAFGTPSR